MPRHRYTNTRERIEKAALELFVSKGVSETRMRDISRAVGLSEGALYRHFDSKEQIVLQLFQRSYLAFARQLQTVAEREGTVKARVAAMICEFCQAHDENPTLFRFLLFVQHEQLHKLVTEIAPTPVQIVRAVLDRAVASGELPDQSPDLATAMLLGLVLEPVQFAAYGQLAPEMRPLSARLAAAVWAALTSVPEKQP